MLLYKYLSSSLTTVLENRSVRFTSPSEFNDPFETAFAITALKPAGKMSTQLAYGLHDALVAKYYSTPALRNRFPSLDQFLVFASPFITQGLAAIEADSVQLSEHLREQISTAYRRIGVLCLAEQPDVMLMWAHYGDSHRGFVVGFDSTHPWFHPPADQPGFNRAQRITYADARPARPLSEMSYEDLFLTKHEVWSYEREWRALRPLEQADQVIAGGSVHLFQYPATAVRQVIIGARATDELQRVLRDAATRLGPHVRVSRAVLHETAYAMELTPIAGPSE